MLTDLRLAARRLRRSPTFAIAATYKMTLLAAGLRLLNDLLLVIILLELFRTVVRFLQTEILALEPYLARI